MREALAGLQKTIGEDHPYTATSHNSLGLVLMKKGKYAEAEPQFRQAADAHARVQGKLAGNYASSLGNLAETFKLLKDYRRAEALDREVLEITRQTLGENHKTYARALAELGFVHMYLNEYDKAAPLLKQALAIDEKALGPKHPHSMTCLSNLAYCYQELGKLDEALTLQLRIIELNKQILPPDDPQLALHLSNSSSLYIAKKDFVKALELEQQAMEIFRQGAPQSQNARVSQENVGWLYEQIGYQTQGREDFAAARQAFEKVIEIYSKTYGKDHWRVTNLRLQLSYVNELEKMTAEQRRQLVQSDELYDKAYDLTTRKPGEALVLAEQAWAIRRKLLGDEHWLTITSTMQVSFLYKELGDYPKAEPIYRALPELVRKTRGDMHPTYVTALQNLANLEENLGKYQDSEPEYLKALEIAQKIDAGNNSNVGTILGNLDPCIFRRVATTKPNNSIARRSLSANSSTGPLFGIRGRPDPPVQPVLIQSRDHIKAEPLIREAMEIYKSTLGDQDPRYARAH